MRHAVKTWSTDRGAGTLTCVQITRRVDGPPSGSVAAVARRVSIQAGCRSSMPEVRCAPGDQPDPKLSRGGSGVARLRWAMDLTSGAAPTGMRRGAWGAGPAEGRPSVSVRWALSILDFHSHAVDELRDHPYGVVQPGRGDSLCEVLRGVLGKIPPATCSPTAGALSTRTGCCSWTWNRVRVRPILTTSARTAKTTAIHTSAHLVGASLTQNAASGSDHA